MRINYFQAGGSTPYRTLFPDLAYNPLDEVASDLNQKGIKIERSTLPQEQTKTTKNSADRLSDEQVARMIIGRKGEWAVDGQARKDLLAQKGYNYAIVQGIINKLMKSAASTKKPAVSATPVSEQQTIIEQISPATPLYTPFYPSDQSYIAVLQAANGQNPTGMIDNTTATLLRANNIANENARQNRIAREENLKRLWDLYEDNYYNDALSNPNNYYGAAHADPNRAKTVRHDIKELYQNGYGFYNPAYALKRNALDLYVPSRKQGGQLNYFQQGGLMQQDPVGQVIQGLLQDPQGTMQALSQMQGQQGGKEQVNAILQEIVKRAKSGDQQAVQAVQVLQQAMQGGQQAAPQQAPIAKNGAKLNYLKQLKGKCPEGEELVYMKKGGFVCPVCQKKKLEEGAKVNKKEFFKKDTKKPLDKCGGKMKAKKK